VAYSNDRTVDHLLNGWTSGVAAAAEVVTKAEQAPRGHHTVPAM